MKKWIGIGLAVLAVAACAEKRAKRAEEAMAHYQLAQNLLSKGETTQGFSELNKAAALDPRNAEIQNLLGLAYLQRDDVPKAEEHLANSVRLDPEYSDAQNHLCAVQIQRGKYDEAIGHCSKAIENVTYTTPERAYQNMGVAYQKKGEIPKAVEAFQKALMHNANFVMSRKSLGLVFADQGKWKEASTHLEAAATTCLASPKGAWGNECPEVFYNLGLMQVKLRGTVKAVAAFRNCVEADQQGTYGEKCREKLKILQ